MNGSAFCHLLQVAIPDKQESLHVASENQRFNHPPKDPQRGSEGERINHERSRWLWDEGMVMRQFLKNPTDHLINKVLRAFIGRDFGGEMLLDAKMDRFPRHGLSEVHDAGGHSRNRALVGMRHRVAMEVNAERQIETPLWRSSNKRFEANGRHPSRALLGASLWGESQQQMIKMALLERIVEVLRRFVQESNTLDVRAHSHP
ncbi:MAG TPA: hypothetical protein VF510_26135 [Ktedonobacterales bacterium]